jgi:hypothetical protein
MASQLILKAGLFALSATLVVSASSASNSDELMSEESRHRRLPEMFENITSTIRESLDRLFETPIQEWEIEWTRLGILESSGTQRMFISHTKLPTPPCGRKPGNQEILLWPQINVPRDT